MLKSFRQKINKEMLDLNNTLDQMESTAIYKTFHPIYILLSANRTLYRIDHMIGHKKSLSNFKKIEIIPSIFSDHKNMKLEINNRRKAGKFTNMWRLKNMILNN